jgi:hypothetical protein
VLLFVLSIHCGGCAETPHTVHNVNSEISIQERDSPEPTIIQNTPGMRELLAKYMATNTKNMLHIPRTPVFPYRGTTYFIFQHGFIINRHTYVL